MRCRIFAIVLLLVWILGPTMLCAQTPGGDITKYELGLQQLEEILSSAGKLDSMPSVKVKAKAAAILWNQSPDRARTVFLSLWDFIKQQKDDKSFDQEEARQAVLRNLYPKDQKLANQLLQGLEDRAKSHDSNQVNLDRIKGTNEETKRLARLALQLLDVEPNLAAKVAQQSLSENTTPMAIIALSRLREYDPLLADYVVTSALENFTHQPPNIAMTGLNYIVPYLFPYAPLPQVSEEVEQADEALHADFMSVGYQVLMASLTEPESTAAKNLNAQTVQFRTLQQAFLAASLGALAVRYVPDSVGELNQISTRLLEGLPPVARQGATFQAAVIRRVAAPNAKQDSEDSNTAISVAIAKGQFDNAQTLIDQLKDDTLKKVLAQNLLKAQFKTYLIRGDINAATKTALKVEDVTSRIQMFAAIAKLARQREDWSVLPDLLAEARKTPTSSDRAGPYARALFSLAAETTSFSPSDSLLVLRDAVKQVNALPRSDKRDQGISNPQDGPSAILNNPDRFADSPEMLKAFAALGRDYFDETLVIADSFDNKALQAMARLATIENLLKVPRPSKKPKPVATPPKSG